MDDAPTLAFLRRQAEGAAYVTSVCTGSLVLGAAGLLEGRRATCHWSAVELLSHFGAIPTRERIVFDGRIITAAGVASGIDFALERSLHGSTARPSRARSNCTSNTIRLRRSTAARRARPRRTSWNA